MTMKQAILESIEHWRDNARATDPDDVDISPDACALCRASEFSVTRIPEKCSACPIKLKTGLSMCSGTPYEEASEHHDMWMDYLESTADAENFRAAARAEVDFLIEVYEHYTGEEYPK